MCYTARMLPPFDNELARASTLPASAYVDPAILAAEQRRIFARTWQPVVPLADVREPGTFATAEIAGAPIVVVRDGAGELRGFFNVCRHRAGPVATGKGARKSLTCRYHGWTYSLDGRLVTTPELGEVENFDRSCNGLRPVRVEAWGPFVFANLDAHAVSLAPTLSAIATATERHRLDAMRLVARKVYEVACNWKVYVDNYLEGYHLPTVHPGLYAELDYNAYRVVTHDLWSEQIAPIRPAKPGASGRFYASESPDDALYYWVFPNTMLNIYPDNMSLNVIVPLSADRTATIFEWYRHDDDPEAVARTVAFSDGIQLEDIDICERVQKGLASGAYDRGRFSVKRENGVHHFQSLVHRYLTSS
jgi:choline monooxygenase